MLAQEKGVAVSGFSVETTAQVKEARAGSGGGGSARAGLWAGLRLEGRSCVVTSHAVRPRAPALLSTCERPRLVGLLDAAGF